VQQSKKKQSGNKSSKTVFNPEAVLDSIVNSSPYAMWISDSQGTLIRLNQACRNILQIKDEEVVGKYNIFQDNIVEQQGFMPLVREVFERGKTANFTLIYDSSQLAYLTLEKKTRVILEVTISAIKDSANRVTNAIIQHKDITERKQAEEALRDSEAKYRNLYESMAEGVIYQDKNGDIVSMNPSARKILGISTNEIKNPDDVNAHLTAIHEDGSPYPAVDHPTMVSLRTGQMVKNALMGVYAKDSKELRWININAVPQFRRGEKEPYQTYVTIEDITERKAAEEVIKQSETKFRILAEQSPNMIFINTGSSIAYVNNKCEELLGYSKEELCAPDFNFLTIIAPESRDLVLRNFNRRKQGEEIGSYEYTLIAKGGKKIDAIISMTTINYEKGKAFLGTVTDITERKQAEAKTIELETLKLVDKAKSELLANVSHELRTPLASIKGYIETLVETDVKWNRQQQFEFLRSADQETDRLTFLIRDLLDMSRIDSGKMILDKQVCTVKEILDSASGVLSVLTAKHKLKFVLEPDLPRLEVDKVRIDQVITNLVENSIKFSPEGSQIEVIIKAVNDKVVFSVKDQGKGITREAMGKLFNRFYQVERAVSGKTRGTGLGLAICKGIVEAHSGKIWVESCDGQGSKFSFSISIANTEQKSNISQTNGEQL
jgi:PAS domain S-box-containing protein